MSNITDCLECIWHRGADDLVKRVAWCNANPTNSGFREIPKDIGKYLPSEVEESPPDMELIPIGKVISMVVNPPKKEFILEIDKTITVLYVNHMSKRTTYFVRRKDIINNWSTIHNILYDRPRHDVRNIKRNHAMADKSVLISINKYATKCLANKEEFILRGVLKKYIIDLGHSSEHVNEVLIQMPFYSLPGKSRPGIRGRKPGVMTPQQILDYCYGMGAGLPRQNGEIKILQ